MARSSSRTARTYRSKVDLWLVAIIGASLVAAIVGVAIAGLQEGPMRFTQGFSCCSAYSASWCGHS